MLFDLPLQNIMQVNQRKCSILKSRFSNFDTRSTNEEEGTWKNRKYFQPPSHSQIMNNFNKLQMSILAMFTEAKNKLSSMYKKISTEIKSMNGILSSSKYTMDPKFMLMIEEIEDQIQQKTQQLNYGLESMLVSSQGLQKLSSFLLDKRKISLRKLMSSKSIKTIKSHNGKVLTTVEDINNIDYKCVVRVQLLDKRCDNLGWLTGNWQCLQTLKLFNKNIFHTIPFETFHAIKLKELQITSNQIIDVDFLKGSYYPNLIKLNLKDNKITKIQGIEETDFPSLKFLNLSFNKIRSIQPLEQTYFPELLQLSLNSNRIQSISYLKECDYPYLQVLNIDMNCLSSIKPIQQCKFPSLKILSFCENKIRSIQFLRNCKFSYLQGLLGYNNQIRDISAFQECKLPKIKEILLNNNLIQDISPINKIKYPNLKELDLQNNKVKNDEFLCFVSRPRSITTAKKKYPFLQI